MGIPNQSNAVASLRIALHNEYRKVQELIDWGDYGPEEFEIHLAHRDNVALLIDQSNKEFPQ